MKRYAYAWFALALFTISLIRHWLFGWFTFVDDARAHDQDVPVKAQGAAAT